MKELSLNILDVAKNSVSAGASLIEISLFEDENGWLKLSINDDGCGMSEEVLRGVTDPFYTTRKTRKVGLGLPLLKLVAEQTGGDLKIKSSVREEDHGTQLEATFNKNSIDISPRTSRSSLVLKVTLPLGETSEKTKSMSGLPAIRMHTVEAISPTGIKSILFLLKVASS